MAPSPTLETTRLVLRPFSLDDAGDVQRMAGAPEVADTTLNLPHPYKDGMAEAWIGTHQARFDAGEGVVLAITLRDTSALIGAIEIRIDQRHRRAELGYWIGVPYWRQGYCTEAARAVVAYGFRELNLHKIVATHLVRNPASGRVMQKAGMEREGLMRQHVFNGERFEDLVMYGLLREEWETTRAD
jgi:[ribosomal protein S5]-alanine N-acetyltransferase